MAWYKTGTVSVTNGSATVTGSGTAWVANVRVGDGFAGPDDRLYEITGVSSNTSITISPTYDGSTASGQAYLIWPTSSFGADIVASLNSLISTYSTIATGPGAGKFSNGTAALPGLASVADLDTGNYWDGSNGFGISTGGATRAFFNSSGMALTGLLSGTAVVQTTSDTTTGRVMTVPYRGLGGQASPSTTDANTATTGGPYSIADFSAATNFPSALTSGTGSLLTIPGTNSANMTQIVSGQNSTLGVYIRNLRASTWGAWRVLYDHFTILGAVSQSAGVPTGGIIERGSNANGEYVRFADGTQICTNDNAAITTNPAAFTGTVTSIDGDKLRLGFWF